tara:strand:+ start:688 stop:819 length:132 start_codon:yes stop_codon:yes gene_type:complete
MKLENLKKMKKENLKKLKTIDLLKLNSELYSYLKEVRKVLEKR